MPFSIQKYILRLHVSVDDVLFVEVLHCQHQLSYVKPGLFLLEGDLAGQVVAEILSWAVVQRQIQEIGSLECIMQVDNKGVIGFLEHIGFRDGILQLFF